MKQANRKKLLRNIAFFLILIALTLWLLLKDQNISEVINIIKKVNIQYIVIAIGCMIIYIFLEAVNLGRTLKVLKEKSNIIKNIKYALIGFFFSAITPAASGGQPMQVYYMHKDKISVAHSTLALLINLTSTQITTITIALVSLLFNYQYLNTLLIILLIVGVALNMSALILLLIGIFSRKLSKWLIKLVFRILKFFRYKKLDEKKRKIIGELLKYQSSAKYIKENKVLMLKILCTTIIQFLVFYSISYWTYRALGFNEYNIFEITTMQSVLYATVSGIPLPGAVGVTEGAFVEIYRNVYPETMIKSATLLNRGINFYLFVIISSIVVIINDLYKKKKWGKND